MSNLGLRSDVVQYIPPVGSGLTTAVSVSSGNGSSVNGTTVPLARGHVRCAYSLYSQVAPARRGPVCGKYNDNTISVGYALRHRYDIADLRYDRFEYTNGDRCSLENSFHE